MGRAEHCSNVTSPYMYVILYMVWHARGFSRLRSVFYKCWRSSNVL
jgi:hypothetical protein